MNDKHEDDLDRQLGFILEEFGRKPEPGEPPLESLPPSQRLVPNAPLNERERIVIAKADAQFSQSKQVEHLADAPESSGQGISKPRGKTLTELCREHGIPDLPPDDDLYRTKYILYFPAPLKRPTQNQNESSEASINPERKPS